MAIFILATLDTKGQEAAFLKNRLVELGLEVRLVDAGTGTPTVKSDIGREEVFRAAHASLDDLIQRNDRGTAVTAAARGAAAIVAREFAAGHLDGVLGLGGSAGTTIGTSAMRALPIGVPKVMISTLASGQVRPYVQDKDILMLNSIVDIAGINRISRQVLSEGVAAMAGMVRFRLATATSQDKRLIAATMFGVTTPCVQHARKILEGEGFEVLVFHATGNGGLAMESLIGDRVIAGVLDITTTELADELVGGVLSAGPDRLTAAALAGVPQVVSVGALDMVNFGPLETVPERFRGRKLHRHNANITLMRTTVEENAQLGAEIGRKVAASRGPAAILLPLQGVSAIDAAGMPFDDPAARTALYQAIRANQGGVELLELNCHINDQQFAEAAAKKLCELINRLQPQSSKGTAHV